MNRPTPRDVQVRALARRVADIAAEASLAGTNVASALMAATIHVAFAAHMTRLDVAGWLRALAGELEAKDKAYDKYGAQVRALLRELPPDPARSAGNTTKGKLQ
jgi:hypothetical protein